MPTKLTYEGSLVTYLAALSGGYET